MKIRTTKPGKGNKFYITKSKGGYSTCVVGNPTDKQCNVLANCVGYACGRFNEIIGSMKYPSLNCNAENFIERAKKLGLQVVKYPTVGGIMVWQKGRTLSGNDGAGHVAIVEKVYNSNKIYTSESGWNSRAFWNSTRTNSNGRWGQSSAYKFRGCIVNPKIGKATVVKPKTPTIPFKTGLYRTLDIMNVRTGAGKNFAIKRYKNLTPDGKKNALYKSPNAYAVYKKGTEFTALKIIKDSNGNFWAKTPSGYVCIKEKNNTYCKKI